MTKLKSIDVPVPSVPVQDSKPPAKRGRPRKADIEAKKTRTKMGRPPGEAARIKEFHARLLTTSGDKVIQTIIRKALDDEDKDQAAMLKMCMDRLLPVSMFEKDKAAARGGVNITITGINGTTEISSQDDCIDMEEDDGPTD